MALWLGIKFFFLFLVYLAALVLVAACRIVMTIWDLLVVACELFVAARGI